MKPARCDATVGYSVDYTRAPIALRCKNAVTHELLVPGVFGEAYLCHECAVATSRKHVDIRWRLYGKRKWHKLPLEAP